MRTIDQIPKTKCICCDGLQTGWLGFGSDATQNAIRVCRTCVESGAAAMKMDGLVLRMDSIPDDGVAMEIADDTTYDQIVEQLELHHTHSARIKDGVCPNGCARMTKSGNVSDCPVCGFQLIEQTLQA